MACLLCSGNTVISFTAKVLGKYTASYGLCDTCGFLSVKDPFWLDEAYSKAIAVADTGLMGRNYLFASKIAMVLYWMMGERGEGRYLDVAGGYGILTRLMRDYGFDFYWQDKYCENLMAPGFEYKTDLGACRAVTAMEVMEHLTDPVAFVTETLASFGAETLIFSTELFNGAPPSAEWYYYSFATGQHIAFYQRRTLECLADRLGLKFASAHGLHVFSKKPVNEVLLNAVTGWVASALAPWVRFRLGSKTMSDHRLMLKDLE